MSREHPQLRVRVPPELKEQLEDMARSSGRTLTAEIVYRLQRSLDEEQEEHVDGFHTIDMKVLDHRNYPPQIGDALRKIEEGLKVMHEVMTETSKSDGH